MGRQFEADVHTLGADVEQQVSRSRDGMPIGGMKLTKWMQLRRPRRPKEDVPCFGTESHYARETCLNVSKSNGAHQGRQVGAKRSNDAAGVVARN